MPKQAQTSEFWKRLTLARTSCVPPKSMRQIDIAKEYGMSHQSAVTKWKTGKSMPDPAVIQKMAIDTNVNVNWLWAAQGDMRPLPVTDPVVHEIVAATNALRSVASRVAVLQAALTQRTLEDPSVAARVAAAQQAAQEIAKHADDHAKRRQRRAG